MDIKKALVSLVFVAGCSGAVDNYKVVRTPTINLYTNMSIGRYGSTLESLQYSHAALSSVFFKNTEIGPVDVLFLDDPDFQALMGNFRKGAAIASVPGGGAETKIGSNGLLILHPFTLASMESHEVELGGGPEASNVDGSRTGIATHAPQANPSRIVGTEMLAHIFVRRALPKAPLWFHEGFSTYVSNLEIREDAGSGQTFICYGYVQPIDGYLGLSKLWDMTFAGYIEPAARNWFRSSSEVFIDFIIHGENNAHRAALMPMVAGLANGTPSPQLVKEVFAMDPTDLDERVKVHREVIKSGLATATNARGQCPFGFLLPPDKKPGDDFPVVGDVPPAEMEALFRALHALPSREEFPPYYPAEVIAPVNVPEESKG